MSQDERFEDQWTYSGTRLRDLLVKGEKIVIHCLGGLGRTGTIAGRLLVEFGASPNEAIRVVRSARIGTIETRKQEEHVKNCKQMPSARTSRSREERALAVLLGGAIGDAFGYAVEFDSISKIRTRFGSLGIAEPILHDRKLIVSDDTQMTLFTLEGMLRALAKRSMLMNSSDRPSHLRQTLCEILVEKTHNSRIASGDPRRCHGRVRRAPEPLFAEVRSDPESSRSASGPFVVA